MGPGCGGGGGRCVRDGLGAYWAPGLRARVCGEGGEGGAAGSSPLLVLVVERGQRLGCGEAPGSQLLGNGH